MAMSPIPCCHNKGFTLIEVLIALSIIAIAMTAVIKASSQNIRATHYLQNKTTAMWVAEQIINEARVGIFTFSDAEVKQTTEFLGQEWCVIARKEETGNKRIEKVKVSVYEQEETENTTPLITLESYIYHDEHT